MDESFLADCMGPWERELFFIFSRYATPVSKAENDRLDKLLHDLAAQRFEEANGVTWEEARKRELEATSKFLESPSWARTQRSQGSYAYGSQFVDESLRGDDTYLSDYFDDDTSDEYYDWPTLGPADDSYSSFYEREALKYAKEHRVVNSGFYNFPNDLRFYHFGDDTPDEVLEVLGILDKEPITITVATNPLSRHMTAHILSKKESTTESIKLRLNNRERRLTAVSKIDLPAGVNPLKAPEDLLANMTTGILARKQNGAALLKVHLDLMNCAFQAARDGWVFKYDLADALERLGHHRLSNRAIHPETMREHYGRIATLASQWINVFEGEDKNHKSVVDETPYWIIQARRRVKVDDELGLIRVLLPNDRSPIFTKLVIEPGLWWDVVDMSHFHIRIPSEVLKLSNGKEVDRMAIQLTATLAVWVRSSQKQHALTERPYRVGELLKASSIKTEEEFFQDDPTVCKRLRQYLAGEDYCTGALGKLRELKAFDIDIMDDDDFCASGHHWRERFWDARLKVMIPKLFEPKLRP